MNNLETKRQRIEMFVKIAALGVLGFVIAPFVFLSIKGLIGLLIAGAISFTAIQFLPYFAALVGNWRLKALKHEASKNPVETLQNIYNEKDAALKSFLQSINTFAAKIKTFESKLDELSKSFPSEVPKFEEQKSQMIQLLAVRKRKYKEAQANLVAFDLEIKKADTIWQVSRAAADATKAAGMNEDEFFAKIQRETAFDAVQESLNVSFAELETALMEENDKPKSLPSSVNSNVIEINVKPLVKVN